MAALRGLLRTVKIFSTTGQHRLLSTSKALCVGGWNKDWKPAPYPTSQAERDAAAKKYGLNKEDYKPTDDDGLGAGDYPKLPEIGMHEKDNFENYDFPHLKRNYGDPLHEEFDAMTAERLDPSHPQTVLHNNGLTPNQMVLILCGLLLVTFGLGFSPVYRFKAAMAPQYKYGYHTDKNTNNVHYTFEPAE